MKYSSHKIKPNGFIEVREETEDGIFHRFVIAPNQTVEKYNEQIESDPDFENTAHRKMQMRMKQS